MKIQLLNKKEDLAEIHLLQKEIYHLDAEDSLPYHTLVTLFSSGCLIYKVNDGSKIIGFSILILGTDKNHQFLHLYMIGVLKSYQMKNIAFKLMEKQKAEAKARGIGLIKWSFNPYSCQLANFYINKCKSKIGNSYRTDMYLKEPSNSLNADRIISFIDFNQKNQSTKNNAIINSELIKLKSYIAIDTNTMCSEDIYLNSRWKLHIPPEKIKSNKKCIKIYRDVFSRLLKNYILVKFDAKDRLGVYYFCKLPLE